MKKFLLTIYQKILKIYFNKKIEKKRPCKNCPFRLTTNYYFSSQRANEICDSFLEQDKIFLCHDNNHQNYKIPCIGSLILLKRIKGSIYHNLSNRLLGMMIDLKEENLKLDEPSMCSTREQFIRSNSVK